ncbi:hypothetical protein KZO11_10070 [Streptomyces anulatus]|uniref:hypothetical protein n=1 Tax=Streptomyces anulatus TaxID=1892 RepID=UPI001C5CCE36|nr:hypothetical protein [Streptomyces anulatus]QYA94030.1 hypothetical protein KZO11_10070 [Streptomyces anulatus]
MNLCLLCEQPDETGSYLCPGCSKATRVRLEALPVLYRGLGTLLAPSTAVSQGRGGKGGPPPLPVAEGILDMRGVMVGTLEDWLSAVRQERGMRQHPAARRGVDGRLDAAVEGLLRHMPWITVSWPQAGEFAGEIRDLAGSVASILRPSAPERGARVGNCPAVDPSGAICGAVLHLAPGEKAIVCPWCTCSYPPYVWAQLKTWVDEDTAAHSVA